MGGDSADSDRLIERMDEMLATVEDNASHWSIWPKFLWMGLGSPIVRAQFAD